MGVYINQVRINKNEFFKLERGDIITLGIDLSKTDSSKVFFKFLSYELKFKSKFVDLTLSENENESDNENEKKKESLKVPNKTTENGIKTVENIPKHRNNNSFSSCSSAVPFASHTSSDDEKEKTPQKTAQKKVAEKKIENKLKSDIKSNQNEVINNCREQFFGCSEKVSQNDRSPRNEVVREPPMVEIPKNSHLNKPKCAIEIEALPQKSGKRRASENIQNASKRRAIESTSSQSPVRASPISMQSPCETPQNNFPTLYLNQEVPDGQELITNMIINWRYHHMKAGQKYTTQLNMLPPTSFDSLDTFKK